MKILVMNKKFITIAIMFLLLVSIFLYIASTNHIGRSIKYDAIETEEKHV